MAPSTDDFEVKVLPPSDAQTQARFHRFRIGALDCIALSDGSIRNPLPPRPAGSPDPAPGAPEFRFVPLSCLLVRMPETKQMVLMDSGFGFDPALVGAMLRSDGRLVESLALAGFAPSDIDVVLISHLDPDHISGLYDSSEAKTYPRARYYAPAEAVAFWSQENLDISASPCPPPVKKLRHELSRRLIRIAGETLKTFQAGDEVLPGISTMPLPGHAPGQVGFILASQGETLFYSADAIAHEVISVETPEVHNVMDLDPELGSETRAALLKTIHESGWHTFSPHFPWPNFGKVQHEGGRRFWKPASH